MIPKKQGYGVVGEVIMGHLFVRLRSIQKQANQDLEKLMTTKFNTYKEIIERLIGKKDEEPEVKKRVPLWEDKVCFDREHLPPKHKVYLPGQHFHECPSCHTIIEVDK